MLPQRDASLPLLYRSLGTDLDIRTVVVVWQEGVGGLAEDDVGPGS